MQFLKLKYFLAGLLLGISLFTLTTCKKYDEGGFVIYRIMHLFGHNKNGANKNWNLIKYEVDGIDSTDLILGASPGFEKDFIQFYMQEKRARSYYAKTSFYNYIVGIEKHQKTIGFATGPYNPFLEKNDTLQCFQNGSTTICQRKIFSPEKKWTTWNISKLTKKELIIEVQLNHKYKIILNSN